MKQLEKAIQAHGVALLRSLGGAVFVIGTRRRRGDFQGTMQTPGIPDVLAFLAAGRYLIDAGPGVDEDGCPYRRGAKHEPCLLWWEAKAPGGRMSPDQRAFQLHCQVAHVAHVVGDLDALIAWLCARGYCKPDQFPHYRTEKLHA